MKHPFFIEGMYADVPTYIPYRFCSDILFEVKLKNCDRLDIWEVLINNTNPNAVTDLLQGELSDLFSEGV